MSSPEIGLQINVNKSSFYGQLKRNSSQDSSGLSGNYLRFNLPYCSHYYPEGLSVGDINNDGRKDIAIGDFNYGLVVLYLDTALHAGIELDRQVGQVAIIFPNPAQEKIYVMLNENIKVESVNIYNSFGLKIIPNFSFSKSGQYLEINTALLPQGIYFLELSSEMGTSVNRFIRE